MKFLKKSLWLRYDENGIRIKSYDVGNKVITSVPINKWNQIESWLCLLRNSFSFKYEEE